MEGPRGSFPAWLPALAGLPRWAWVTGGDTQLSACFRRVLPGADQPAVPEGTRERASLHLQCCGGWLPVRVSPGPGGPGHRGCARGVWAGTGHVGAFAARDDGERLVLCCGRPAVPGRSASLPLSRPRALGSWCGFGVQNVGRGSGRSTKSPFICTGGARGGAVPWGRRLCCSGGHWAWSRRDSRAPAWRPVVGTRAMLLC